MSKFVEVLARHERAILSVAEITSQIGKALKKCPVQLELDAAYDLQWKEGDYSNIERLTDEQGRTKTHLWHALSGRGQDYRGDGDVIEYLADDENGCTHCAKAFDLILQRKKARQELGAARRLIRHYGKRAMAELAGGDQ